MCGIAGVLRPGGTAMPPLDTVHRLQGHRGPDGRGQRSFETGPWQLAFSHQRLAVIDLSDAAAQPMLADDGSALVFNGEIYNYLELRQELETSGQRFSTRSDTEVLLAALRVWGAAALERLNGMWAFAWYDRPGRRLLLSRDRVGIKPLYHVASSRGLVFASEIKTLLWLSGRRFELDPAAISAYLDQSLLDASPRTMFAGVESLPAGSLLEIDLTDDVLRTAPRSYWKVPLDPVPGVHDRSPAEIAEELRALFEDAVRLRLRSDVPVGILLSGGVDSSAIAATAGRLLGPGADLHLLTAGSDDATDESAFAARVAADLGHVVGRVDLAFTPQEAIDLLHRATWHHDEPLGSFTSVAHYLLMKAAAERGVTVILSGQGADELLCGYRKYLGFHLQQLLHDRRLVSAATTLAGFTANRSVVTQFSLAEGRRYLPSRLLPPRPDVRGPALAGQAPVRLGLPRGMTVQERQALDVGVLSVPQLLHYEDRMSMAWSREVRLPFMDHRLVELLVPLATDLKLRSGWSKWIFRHAMDGLVPDRALWRRDKRGFENPGGEWLKNELRSEVLALFGEDARMVRYGLVDRAELMRTYEAFRRQPRTGGTIWFKDVFNPLALELWLRAFDDHLSGTVAEPSRPATATS